MLPLGHAAFAYLFYVGVADVKRHPLPATWAFLPLLIGSQFPDLVDKPLAYNDIAIYGRSVAHSLIIFAIVCGLVWWLARRYTGCWPPWDRREQLREFAPLAFAVGYGSHLLGDAAKALLSGRFYDARFVLWPVYAMPASPADDIAPWTRLLTVYQAMETHPQLELIVTAVLVFIGIRVLSIVRR